MSDTLHSLVIIVSLLICYIVFSYEKDKKEKEIEGTKEKRSELEVLLEKYSKPITYDERGTLDSLVSKIMGFTHKHQDSVNIGKKYLIYLKSLFIISGLLLLVSVLSSIYITAMIIILTVIASFYIKILMKKNEEKERVTTIVNAKKYLYNKKITHYQFDILMYNILKKDCWNNKKLLIEFINNLECVKYS